MGQGTVKKRWGVKFYALAVSVFVHAAALTIFAAVKLTQPKAETANQTAAVVNINRASILAERPAVTAKPKVVSGNRIEAAAKGASILKSQISSFKKIPNPDYQSTNEERSVIAPINDVGAAPEKIGTTESLVINETQGGAKENAGKMPATQVEFFDSPASGRRICYVVDCSGSMQGLWGQVRAELIESIGQLQPDQYFSVIVFGAGSIMDSGGGRMVRASERAKKEAYEFIGALRPRGVTNAAAAIEQAIKIRDGSGSGPSVIYFLSDGFELSEQGNLRFAHQVETMLKNYSPKTQINTIGFWCDEEDRSLLESIAKKSGGRFTFVGQSGEKQ